MFVNMLFTNDYLILIKNLYLPKEYTVQVLLKNIPSMGWIEHSIWKLLKDETSVQLTGVQGFQDIMCPKL